MLSVKYNPFNFTPFSLLLDLTSTMVVRVNNRDYNCQMELTERNQMAGHSRDGRFGSKVGQIGPKWDKSGAFSDQISVHLAIRAKCTEI